MKVNGYCIVSNILNEITAFGDAINAVEHNKPLTQQAALAAKKAIDGAYYGRMKEFVKNPGSNRYLQRMQRAHDAKNIIGRIAAGA